MLILAFSRYLQSVLSEGTPSPLVTPNCCRPTQHHVSLQRLGAEAAKPLWKSEIIERGGMLSAIQEINSALDGEQWAIVSYTAGAREPGRGGARCARRETAWRRASRPTTGSADAAPNWSRSTRSLCFGAGDRTLVHDASRDERRSPRSATTVQHDAGWSRSVTTKKPFLASLIEDGPTEDEDARRGYTGGIWAQPVGGGTKTRTNTLQAPVIAARRGPLVPSRAYQSTSGAWRISFAGERFGCLSNLATDSRTSRR